MTYYFIKKQSSNAIFWLALIALLVSGCSKEAKDYKADSDERVYKILDKKWDPNTHGVKTNYKISDVEADGQAITIARAVPASGVLTLSDAVAIATAHSREYQLEKENLYISALDLNLTRHDFEMQFFGGGSADYQYDGFNGNLQQIGGGPVFGFSKFLQDGTLITTDLTLAWVDILTGDFRSGLAGIFNAAVTKPLLRGSQREIVMENLTQAERNALYQIRYFSRFRKTFVVSIITQYYEVLQQYDRIKNAEDNYAILISVCDKAEKLTKVGKLPRYELNEARQDKLHARDDVVKEKKLYKQMLDEFKLSLALPTDSEFTLDETEFIVLKAKKMPEPTFTNTESVETALNNRLDLLNSLDSIDDAARKVMVTEDALRAEMNLVVSTVAASERRQSLKGLNHLTSQVNAGVALDLGLERTFEQTEYRKSLITLNQSRRFYQQSQDQVKLEVRNAYRDLIEATERHSIQVENLQLAKKRFDNTMLLLKYGRADTRDVLDSQEDYFDAQNDAADASVNYAIAMLNFYRDTGVMQVKPDGMW